MTYQPNPDAPIASEQHPELYERMCKARAFIEQVLVAYVKARKANGMTKPNAVDLGCLEATLVEDISDQFSINDTQCEATLGETFTHSINETETLITENWK